MIQSENYHLMIRRIRLKVLIDTPINIYRSNTSKYQLLLIKPIQQSLLRFNHQQVFISENTRSLYRDVEKRRRTALIITMAMLSLNNNIKKRMETDE